LETARLTNLLRAVKTVWLAAYDELEEHAVRKEKAT
jgi:hypothetical protein